MFSTKFLLISKMNKQDTKRKIYNTNNINLLLPCNFNNRKKKCQSNNIEIRNFLRGEKRKKKKKGAKYMA